MSTAPAPDRDENNPHATGDSPHPPREEREEPRGRRIPPAVLHVYVSWGFHVLTVALLLIMLMTQGSRGRGGSSATSPLPAAAQKVTMEEYLQLRQYMDQASRAADPGLETALKAAIKPLQDELETQRNTVDKIAKKMGAE